MNPRTHFFCVISLILLLLSACNAVGNENTIQVTIQADGQTSNINVPDGYSVQQALDQAGIPLNVLDRVIPPSYSLLRGGDTVVITRVVESFEVEETTIPYERQTIQNESLPQDDSLLIQPGINGTQQTTYRILTENGVETSRSVFSISTLTQPQPEIIMVGVQAPFQTLTIPGQLVYLIAGNAWIMEGSTTERRPVVTTGDLDGRIFSVSPDGDWLLFTRSSNEDGLINTLWVVSLNQENPDPMDLGVSNIIHYAGWVPGSDKTITYSTVEPRSTPPGWQANNDLYILSFTSEGQVTRNEERIETNGGGSFGWWGLTFSWSPDGTEIAYSRPDGIGLTNISENQFLPLIEQNPYNTGSDWAWTPGISWSADSNTIYSVNNVVDPMASSATTNSRFDLIASILDSGATVTLVENTGMFAYPSISPLQANGQSYLAYLQSANPAQSETSAYSLMLCDRDGSNKFQVFPPTGAGGLEPQQVVWAPYPLEDSTQWLGVIYQGNLWLIDAVTDQAYQVTGDGLISRIDWK